MIGNDGFSKAQATYDAMEEPEPTDQQVRDHHREELERVLHSLEEVLRYMKDELNECEEVKTVEKAYSDIESVVGMLKQ
jgi:hypothetical protein